MSQSQLSTPEGSRRLGQTRHPFSPLATNSSVYNDSPSHSSHFWPSRGLLWRRTAQRNHGQQTQQARQNQSSNNAGTPTTTTAPSSLQQSNGKLVRVPPLDLLSEVHEPGKDTVMSAPSTPMSARGYPSLAFSVPATIAGAKRSAIPKQTIVLECECTFEQSILINGKLCVTATTLLFFAKREQPIFSHINLPKRDHGPADEEDASPLLVILLEQVGDVRLVDGESSVPGIEIVMLPFAVVQSVLPAYFFGFPSLDEAKAAHRTIKKLYRRIKPHSSTRSRRTAVTSTPFRKLHGQQQSEQDQQQQIEEEEGAATSAATTAAVATDETISKEQGDADDGKSWSTLRSTLEMEHQMLSGEAPQLRRLSPSMRPRSHSAANVESEIPTDASTSSRQLLWNFNHSEDDAEEEEEEEQKSSLSHHLSRPIGEVGEVKDGENSIVCACPHCSQLISINKQLLKQLSLVSSELAAASNRQTVPKNQREQQDHSIVQSHTMYYDVCRLDPIAVIPISFLYIMIFGLFSGVVALIIFL